MRKTLAIRGSPVVLSIMAAVVSVSTVSTDPLVTDRPSVRQLDGTGGDG